MRRIQSAGRAQLVELFYDAVAGRRSLVVAAEQGDPPARAARSGGDGPHRTEDAGDRMCAVQSVAVNPRRRRRGIDLVRDRLAGLRRQYTPVDLATAMRSEGLIVNGARGDRQRKLAVNPGHRRDDRVLQETLI